MRERLLSLFAFAGIGAGFEVLHYYRPSETAHRAFLSFAALAASHLIFRLLATEIVTRRVKDAKARYSLRKGLTLSFWLVSLIVILRIWAANPQTLLVAYGLIGAGVAVALQDLFKNLAGGLILVFGGVYRVGDRIAVGEQRGDVIDIGLLYTSVLEIGEWVDGDQATGRINSMPNGLILSETVHNYTKDHRFIWDEFVLPVTHVSNWRHASAEILKLVSDLTAEATAQAKEEVGKLEEKYYLSRRNMEPAIFVKPTDNWIALHVRYVAEVRDRRLARNKISEAVLSAVASMKDVEIASQTLTVTSVQPAGSSSP